MEDNKAQPESANLQELYATSVHDELLLEESKLEEEGRRIVHEQNLELDWIEYKYQQVRARRETIERFGESPVFDSNRTKISIGSIVEVTNRYRVYTSRPRKCKRTKK